MTAPTLGRIRLASTTLAAAAYSDSSRQLELEFVDGRRYVYSGVTERLYRDLLGAVSKGTFFNQYIRGHFSYAKLPIEN
jgi:hypothetical protein